MARACGWSARELVRQLGVEGPEELAEPDEEGRPVQIG